MSEQENVGLEVIQSNSGTVTYADDVIATIAGLAAAEIEGVAGMSGGMVEGIGELLLRHTGGDPRCADRAGLIRHRGHLPSSGRARRGCGAR